MTEFELLRGAVLGLMPATGAERLLGSPVSAPPGARAELYLIVDSPEEYHMRAISSGARELSPLSERDWGHTAAYSVDPDGNVLAFARIT